MATSSEQPESAHTLPRPELNPLLNPLLAENMGRWAEVYFTAPVDRREEAVLDLLRELEAEEEVHSNASVSGGVLNAVPRAEVQAKMESPSQPTSHAQSSSTRCPSCGHENPASHQFCGMCGVTFEPSATAGAVAAGIAGEGAAARPEVDSAGSREDRTPREEYYEHSTNPHELSLFRSLKGRDGDYDLDYEPPPPRPYRYYVGAILAIVIAVLAYMAWRSEQVGQSTHQPPGPPPAAVTETGTPSAESFKQNTDTTVPPAAGNEARPKAVTEPRRAITTPAALDRAAQETPKNEPVEKTSASSPAAAASAERPAPGNGSEELAMAQRYLSGGDGRVRDGAEASKWLWKSIAKHNGEATLLLSDLYLKGDGVPKNCDQARVLLDSAARRGIAGAGERLRNLRAFGCQ